MIHDNLVTEIITRMNKEVGISPIDSEPFIKEAMLKDMEIEWKFLNNGLKKWLDAQKNKYQALTAYDIYGLLNYLLERKNDRYTR